MPGRLKNILDKLLWKGKSKWLMSGAVVGAFAGLWLLLSAVQFYLDVKQLMQGDVSPADQFVQVNKRVNLLNTLGVKAAFSEEEISEIQRQPFIESVGKFTSNDFKAGASSDMLGFYTELFFESVPKEFLDVKDYQFRWSEGQEELPILISRDYLALYNFGFAPSQGLPQLSPATIGKLKMEIQITGNNRQEFFTGQIIGFSDRINSILVPEEFMKWANRQFGNGENGSISRLILKVKNPLSKEFRDFLKKQGYEVSSGRLIGSQFGVLLRLILGIVGGLGLLILGLSVLVFALNFQLLVAQSAADIRLLLEIGHFPGHIAGLLNRRFVVIFTGVVISVFLVLWLSRMFLVRHFQSQGFELPKSLSTQVWLLGIGFSLLLIFLNIRSISSSVHRLSR